MRQSSNPTVTARMLVGTRRPGAAAKWESLAGYVDDRGEGNQDQADLVAKLSWSETVDIFCMAELMDAVRERAEDVYGWCGLCRSFTEFPHECWGENGTFSPGPAHIDSTSTTNS